MNRNRDASIQLEREEAWIGDAVLSLVARLWILRESGRMDGEALTRLTNNQFLACLGNPTAVEARIGRIYAEHGFAAAQDWFEAELVPLFRRQEAKRARRCG